MTVLVFFLSLTLFNNTFLSSRHQWYNTERVTIRVVVFCCFLIIPDVFIIAVLCFSSTIVMTEMDGDAKVQMSSLENNILSATNTTNDDT